MKKLAAMVLVTTVLSLSHAQELPHEATVTRLDLSQYFAGHKGCFVLYDCSTKEYAQYNTKLCAIRFTPCSTFKIANSLIALQTGAASDTSLLIRYDSTKHPLNPEMLKVEPFKHWPRDQTMTTAFRYSVVWYYQEIATMIGITRMQRYLDSLGYGNEDISSGIDHFWLGGSLKISANEQVQLVGRLIDNRLQGFSVSTQEKVKGIMLRESTSLYMLYGKTGGCDGPNNTAIGWYVGFVSTTAGTYAFAMNIFANSFEELAGNRSELTKEILHGMGIL